MSIRIIVVDDEPLAREGVKFQLLGEADVEIVAECEDGTAAVRAINIYQPDLVYLDIKMPKVSGFDVIQMIGVDKMPLVVFLTAYDEYAVQAFRCNAVDYLLKPIEKEMFKISFEKAKEQLFKDRLLSHRSSLRNLLSELDISPRPIDEVATPVRISVRLSGEIQFLHPDEINWIESEGDYVKVHTGKRTHLVRETMHAIEAKLYSQGFHRIHRSTIVNLGKVQGMILGDSGSYDIQLLSGERFKIGRNYRHSLYVRMQIGD